jgi:hypothetical protein
MHLIITMLTKYLFTPYDHLRSTGYWLLDYSLPMTSVGVLVIGLLTALFTVPLHEAACRLRS